MFGIPRRMKDVLKPKPVELAPEEPAREKTDEEKAVELLQAKAAERQAREATAKEKFDAFVEQLKTEDKCDVVVVSGLQQDQATGGYFIVSQVGIKAND